MALLVNQFTRGLKLTKCSEALILEPPPDSVAARKTAEKYASLKLVEEKHSFFASSVSTHEGYTHVSEKALVATSPQAPHVPSQPRVISSLQGPVQCIPVVRVNRVGTTRPNSSAWVHSVIWEAVPSPPDSGAPEVIGTEVEALGGEVETLGIPSLATIAVEDVGGGPNPSTRVLLHPPTGSTYHPLRHGMPLAHPSTDQRVRMMRLRRRTPFSLGTPFLPFRQIRSAKALGQLTTIQLISLSSKG